MTHNHNLLNVICILYLNTLIIIILFLFSISYMTVYNRIKKHSTSIINIHPTFSLICLKLSYFLFLFQCHLFRNIHRKSSQNPCMLLSYHRCKSHLSLFNAFHLCFYLLKCLNSPLQIRHINKIIMIIL